MEATAQGLSRRRAAPRALVACLAALLAMACSGRPPRELPHVLVVTLDTVRADRLGAYGQTGRRITPRMDALADQSVLFEQAIASSSFTPPTHASMFTGLHPPEHGLMHWNKPLAPVPTAAELFAAAGFRTGAFSPLPTLFKLGLDRGFETAVSPPHHMQGPQILLADADAINEAALPWLLAEDDRPFFAWVHYYDAHRPYGRQGPQWAGRFRDDDDPTVGATERWYQLTPERREALGLTPLQAEMIKDHYDGGLAYLDDRLGRLLDALDEAGLLERTLLVVIADHGEVLDEHEAEWFSHDPWLVEENVRIPFLLRLPGGHRAGLRVGALVGQVDLLPTLLDLAGVEPPGLDPRSAFSGESLRPLLDGRPWRRPAVYADRIGDDRTGKQATPEEVAASRDRQRMLRTGSRKLLHYEDRGRIELWALEDEGHDVSDSEPELRRELGQRYGELLQALRLPEQGAAGAALSPEIEEFLRGLGYIGPGEEDG
jgi:arylsulfatase A-like enzyme